MSKPPKARTVRLRSQAMRQVAHAFATAAGAADGLASALRAMAGSARTMRQANALGPVREIRQSRDFIVGKTCTEGFADVDAAQFPPGAVHAIRVTEGGKSRVFKSLGREVRPGVTRFDFSDADEVKG